MICFKRQTCRVAGVTVLVLLIGCNSSQRFAERGVRPDHSETPPHTIQPEQNSGRILLTLEGTASYYAHDFHGKQTSSGEIYDMNSFTAAHRTFPFGTKVRVTNLENKKSVVVKVNDRGPFKEGRIIDLSMGAAKKIDLILNGTARVRLDVLEWGTGQ
jgi:rare lipoprotein A